MSPGKREEFGRRSAQPGTAPGGFVWGALGWRRRAARVHPPTTTVAPFKQKSSATMSAVPPAQLRAAIEATMSADATQRNQAEEFLKQAEHQPGYIITMLELIQAAAASAAPAEGWASPCVLAVRASDVFVPRRS